MIYSPSGGICLSVGGVFGRHALDKNKFPGVAGVLEAKAKHGWFQSHYVHFNVEASREPLPLPLFNLWWYIAYNYNFNMVCTCNAYWQWQWEYKFMIMSIYYWRINKGIFPTFMQLLGYAHGYVYAASDNSPDMLWVQDLVDNFVSGLIAIKKLHTTLRPTNWSHWSTAV